MEKLVATFTQIKESETVISDGRLGSLSSIYLSPSWLERPCLHH